jgi:membrane associated rhomboid family serine protease
MKMKYLLITCTVSVIAAVLVTVILKSLGVEETAGIAGGVAGAISGVVATTLYTKDNKDA